MRIHKEGTTIILCSAIASAGITAAGFALLPDYVEGVPAGAPLEIYRI